jgi:TM2 domain-containing membrane protein YozV
MIILITWTVLAIVNLIIAVPKLNSMYRDSTVSGFITKSQFVWIGVFAAVVFSPAVFAFIVSDLKKAKKD